IHGLTPHLSELSRAGMSAYGIAAELNRRKVSAINGVPWDAASVISATNLMKILEPNCGIADRRVVCRAQSEGTSKPEANGRADGSSHPSCKRTDRVRCYPICYRTR